MQKRIKLRGEDLDYHRRDLFTSIEKGEFPKWLVQSANYAGERCGNVSYPPI